MEQGPHALTHSIPSSGLDPPTSPWGPSCPNPGSGVSGGLTRSHWPQGCHSLDLPVRPLLHELHFVLALEPGGGKRASVTEPSGAGSPDARPSPTVPSPHLALSRGSIMFLFWKLLNRSRRMLPSGCGHRGGGLRAPGRNPGAGDHRHQGLGRHRAGGDQGQPRPPVSRAGRSGGKGARPRERGGKAGAEKGHRSQGRLCVGAGRGPLRCRLTLRGWRGRAAGRGCDARKPEPTCRPTPHPREPQPQGPCPQPQASAQPASPGQPWCRPQPLGARGARMGVITGHGPPAPPHPTGQYLQGPQRVGQLRAELHVDVGGLVPGDGTGRWGPAPGRVQPPPGDGGLGRGLGDRGTLGKDPASQGQAEHQQDRTGTPLGGTPPGLPGPSPASLEPPQPAGLVGLRQPLCPPLLPPPRQLRQPLRHLGLDPPQPEELLVPQPGGPHRGLLRPLQGRRESGSPPCAAARGASPPGPSHRTAFPGTEPRSHGASALVSTAVVPETTDPPICSSVA